MEKTVSGLTCNHLTDPLGIDSHPVFSWKYDGGNQTAYQIGVASSLANLSAGVYDCWDSGKVMSDRSHYVEYEGQSLESRTSYYWTATVYADGEMTAEAPAHSKPVNVTRSGQRDGLPHITTGNTTTLSTPRISEKRSP